MDDTSAVLARSVGVTAAQEIARNIASGGGGGGSGLPAIKLSNVSIAGDITLDFSGLPAQI